MVSHGGSWGGYRAQLMRFPEQHFSVATLCNLGSSDPTRRATQVADVYLNSVMKPKTVKSAEADDEEPKERGGDDSSDEGGTRCRMPETIGAKRWA